MGAITISGAVGFRDVGGMPAAGGRIRSGRLFRSGHLADLSSAEADLLRARVRRIVDLRADDEVAAAPAAATGIPTTRLPLYLGSTRSFFLEDYSLGEIYAHLFSECAPQLVTAVRVIAAGTPALVHCTAGKDRTGVTIALALSAVGGHRDAVVDDYALTAELMPAEVRRATSARLAAAYPASQHAWMLATESPAEVMRTTLADLDAEWGSPADYLRAHGLTTDELEALRVALVVDPTTPGTATDEEHHHDGIR